MPEWLQTMDETVLRWIGEHLRVPALDGLVSGFTGLGDAGALFIILAVILLLFRTTRRAGGTALTAMTFGLIVTNSPSGGRRGRRWHWRRSWAFPGCTWGYTSPATYWPGR